MDLLITILGEPTGAYDYKYITSAILLVMYNWGAIKMLLILLQNISRRVR